MAKKGGGSSEPESSRLLSELARDMYTQTAPLRGAVLQQSGGEYAGLAAAPKPYQAGMQAFNNLAGRSNRFLAGGLDVTQSPMYGAMKQGVEQEYGAARDLLLSQVPRGGAQTAGLVDLAGQRAGMMTGIRGDLAQQELARAERVAQTGLADRSDAISRAFGLASMGGVDPGSALAQSAAAQSAAMQAGAQRSAGKGSALGSLGAAAIKRL